MSSKRKQKPSETDVNLDAVGIGDIVAQIIVEIQPMIAKTVTEAINGALETTTKVIISELKEEIQSCIKTIKDDMCKVKQEIQKQSWKLDALEQYSRRESIKIIGLAEPAPGVVEDTTELVVETCRKIGVDVSRHDISVCHRLPGRAKAVIAKFVRREKKIEVMKAKKQLKEIAGPKLMIFEDLTSLRSALLRELKKDPNVRRTFTRDGRIHCIVSENGREKKVTLDNPDDLFKLAWSEERIKNTHLYMEY